MTEPLNIPGEEWRDIEEWPYHQVSNLGRVKTLARIVDRFNPRWGCPSPRRVRERILKQWPIKYRHRGKERIRDDSPVGMAIRVGPAGKAVTRYVHHLVLEAFVGLRPQGTEACHEDGDATNNRLSNLRWDTSSANKADSVRHGTFWPKLRAVRES